MEGESFGLHERFKDLEGVYERAKDRKHGRWVWGKRVGKEAARRIRMKAQAVVAAELTVAELARVMNDLDLTLESYFQTLKDIRDDAAQRPADRIRAADKILQAQRVILHGDKQPGAENHGRSGEREDERARVDPMNASGESVARLDEVSETLKGMLGDLKGPEDSPGDADDGTVQ